MPFDEAIERFARVNTKDVEATVCSRDAAPFVKWAGGKRGIIDQLVNRLPDKFGEYYEPFAGGAALFFEISDNLKKAYISDSNLDLMITYAVVKDMPDALIKKLEDHAKKDSEEYYYKVRAQHNLKDAVDTAARFIYLNKTCYNGLYRVNKKGEFNVPRGRYANPDVVNKENILAASQALKKAELRYREFDKITPKSGDLVYFDPPYHPTDTASFTQYTKLDFSEKDQQRLANFALELHRQGVYVMLSNSDTPYIRNLYNNTAWNLSVVSAPRLVNCKAEGRVAVKELLVRNYAGNDPGRDTG
ncbi:DNA adenine methylase [Dehalogenimonas etheniformans]|uniref:Site-specific DNA-methyltransferase (adenine-specific) n=2 Tax=Dehalogenimonas etheniformans TaxID=1536648 RepID=A0A2P5P527_9CHLR|nr:DNA adenine methylase [Dehalogenimonas etheniformans]PPD57404.1 DNA adenine methylase [Dehalogenimonas etheniformans]QNT77002.1 DNA adenine methylase [Dehalogenimonas etheniformans]